MIINYDFFDTIKNNKVVQDYYIYTTTIHKGIINTDNIYSFETK